MLERQRDQASLVFVGPGRTLPARSPFVNSLLNRLKGHHASLVGCQAVEGTPELITADSSGVVKVLYMHLWNSFDAPSPPVETRKTSASLQNKIRLLPLFPLRPLRYPRTETDLFRVCLSSDRAAKIYFAEQNRHLLRTTNRFWDLYNLTVLRLAWCHA